MIARPVVLLVLTSLVYSATSYNTTCHMQVFASADLDPKTWNGGGTNYCFGNPKGQHLIYSQRVQTAAAYGGHHAGLVCKITTVRGHITAGAVLNADSHAARFIEKLRNTDDVVLVIKSDQKAQAVNVKMSFWGSAQEEPTVDCVGVDSGKAQCGDFSASSVSGNINC